jgi:carboxyl-terminal processing protease
MNADSINFPDSLKYETNKGRTVYGGGGIMPDIFIPFDSVRYNDLNSSLIRKGIYNSYVNEYMDAKRKYLKKSYSDIDKFVDGFNLDEDEFKDFISQAEKEIEIDEEQLNQTEAYIKLQVKALIARNLFNTSSYYEVLWPQDREIKKALEVLNEDMVYKTYGQLIENPY